MNENDLRNLLTQLHSRLGNSHSLDAEDRRLLTTVLHDIEKAIGAGDAAPPSSAPGLESFAVRFEAGHPALAETLRRLADVLAKAGI